MHSIRTPWLPPTLMKLDTRPRPCPSEISAPGSLSSAYGPGHVVDAKADVMKTFAVLVEPDRKGESPSSG